MGSLIEREVVSRHVQRSEWVRVVQDRRQGTKEGVAVARARGRLKGSTPKLSVAQQRQVVRLVDEGEHTPAEIGAMFNVSRQTVYRVAAAHRAGAM